MINNISFLNHNWFWLIAITALVIWIVFIWKERTKTNRRKFYFNCVIALIALISLSLIALKPSISSSRKSFKAVVLTQNYDKTQLDSLKKVYKKLTVYDYKQNQALIPKDKNTETVFILGNGLLQYDLWQLDSLNVIYIGGNGIKGISNFKYDAKNNVGNDLIINGRYKQPSKHRLFLEDPAGKALDSLVLGNNNVQDFKLSTKLKVKGEFIYQLTEKDSLDRIVSKNPIPLLVAKQKQLRILIVNATPSFETKYLKNYLAESGHKVVVQSRLTKSRYKYEYFNMGKRPAVRFSREQLKPYDLAIVDFQTLNSLSSKAKNAFETSIKENGLGLFIQPEPSLFYKRNRWHSFNFDANRANNINLNINPKKAIAKFPHIFKNGIFIEPILDGKNALITSAYKRLGMGRIGTSVLKNTYELQLKGDSKIYKQIWAKTIENVSKRGNPTVEWSSESVLTYVNEPFHFQLRTNEELPIVFTDKNYQVALKQDVNIKSSWNGTTYPREIGWKTLITKQDSTNIFKYFVTDDSTWQTLKAADIININKKYFNNKSRNHVETKDANKPINPICLFIIFTICIGYLWLEPKL